MTTAGGQHTIIARAKNQHHAHAMLAALQHAGLSAEVRLSGSVRQEPGAAAALGALEISVPESQAGRAEHVLAELEANAGGMDWQSLSPTTLADEGDWNGPGIVWRDEDRWLRRVAAIIFAVFLVALFVVFVLL